MKPSIGAALGAVLLAGCATGYHDMGLTGGVSAQRITEDTAMISARGNAYTDPDRIQQFALRRAAEETLQDGFDWFAIVEQRDRTRKGTVQVPGQSRTTVTGNVAGHRQGALGTRHATTRTTPGFAARLVKPGETVTIHMGHGAKPEGGYDAHEVVAYMTPPRTKR